LVKVNTSTVVAVVWSGKVGIGSKTALGTARG
jgi:hypothetical protein